jgi:large subunit ribosomal protein L10
MKQAVLDQKISDVSELTKKFHLAKSIVILDYQGLTVAEFMALRRKLLAGQCEIAVYKNNIARRAAQACHFEGLDSLLVGPKAVAYSDTDYIAPAKILYEFSKTNKKVSLKGGVLDAKTLDEASILALALLPSREVLLTQLAAGLLAPVRDLAVGLNMIEK